MCSMKNSVIKSFLIMITGLSFLACGVKFEQLVSKSYVKYGIIPGSTILDFDELPGYTDKTYAVINSIKTAINVQAKHRLVDGTLANTNTALLINTDQPNPQNSLVTPNSTNSLRPMGNVLTIGDRIGASMYNKGGIIEVDFTGIGAVVMRGVHVLDIEEHESGSTLELLDNSGRVIATYTLPVTGKGGTSPLITGDIAGVSKLRVNIISGNNQEANGAIDVIQFCPNNKCPF
jgi:hypothetical protein